MPGDVNELYSGTALRTCGPAKDVNGDPKPDEFAFIFNELQLEEDHRGFVGWWVVSCDWEQEESCDGREGALARAQAAGRNHTECWRLDIGELVDAESRLIVAGDDGEVVVPLRVLHWPEEGHPAHMHVAYAPVKRTKAVKKAARKMLESRARPAS